MKPTKEEVYPYLPYEVQCAFTNGKGEIDTYVVNDSNVAELFQYDNVKLVLRPLSDLKKEFIHNGEIMPKGYFHSFSDKISKCHVSDILNNITALDSMFLMKYHFDVFNLIPEKAIDKNTI